MIPKIQLQNYNNNNKFACCAKLVGYLVNVHIIGSVECVYVFDSLWHTSITNVVLFIRVDT